MNLFAVKIAFNEFAKIQIDLIADSFGKYCVA